MMPDAELRAALRILRGEPVPEPHPVRLPPKMPDVYAAPLLGWLECCQNDLAGAVANAKRYSADPFDLVDEPDSVRHALAFARALNGTTETPS